MPFRKILAVGLLGGALAACQQPTATTFQHAIKSGEPTPWTSARFNDHAEDFQFAVIGDRTGLARPGVFEHALTRLNVVRPEFVINVGDMIEGYSEDQSALKLEWDEQDARLKHLEMPFFRVVGNHDMGNNVMREFWRDRYGPDYYHFVYKGALFMVLNSEDPPTPMPEEMRQGFEQIKQLLRTDPEAAKAMLTKNMAAMSEKEREAMRNMASPANFSDAQVAWARTVLEQHKDARWTFLFMHKPAWQMDSPGFARIEQLLADRPYTVFGGHEHNYHHSVRNGRDYVRLGTVGGGIHHAPPGNLDHITVVNFKSGKPRIANLKLDGVLDIDEPQHQ